MFSNTNSITYTTAKHIDRSPPSVDPLVTVGRPLWSQGLHRSSNETKPNLVGLSTHFKTHKQTNMLPFGIKKINLDATVAT